MTNEQIEQCRQLYHGDKEGFVELLVSLKTIESRKYWIEDNFSKEDIRHRDRIAELNKDVEENQNECPHPRPFCEHVPDPWHSYYMCTLCGKRGVRPQ